MVTLSSAKMIFISLISLSDGPFSPFGTSMAMTDQVPFSLSCSFFRSSLASAPINRPAATTSSTPRSFMIPSIE